MVEQKKKLILRFFFFFWYSKVPDISTYQGDPSSEGNKTLTVV